MPIKYSGKDSRKRFWVTRQRADLVHQFARSSGAGSASGLIRSWFEAYIEHGLARPATPEHAVEMKELQSIMPAELVRKAEERAAREGLTLKDILDIEIDALEEL